MNTTRKPRRMARPPLEGEGESAVSDAEHQIEWGPAPATEKRITKQSLVIELLRQVSGASLAEIVEATGWLPHTARAALTGLRKKGHTIARTSVDGETRYTIAPAAVE